MEDMLRKYIGSGFRTLLLAAAVMFAFNALVIQPQLVELSKSAPIVFEQQSVTRYNRPAFFQDTATFEQPVTMDSTLSVAGAATLTGDVTAAGALGVTGLLTANGGATIVGTFATDASEVGATEIANISRTVTIPLLSLIECTTDAGVAINFTDGTDAFPDYTGIATNGLGFFLEFDSTSATEDTAYVCGTLAVPEDFASNGEFELVIGKDAETGSNSEVVNCAISINGASLLAAGTVTTSGTALAAYKCAPTTTALAAGDSMGFEFHITSDGTVDDDTNIYSIGFQYTATQ